MQFNAIQWKTWFDNLWAVYQPYIVAAASEHVEQLSIGREFNTAEGEVPEAIWDTYLSRIHGIFSGILTYDFNWDQIYSYKPVPSFIKNPFLTYIGISMYMPLESLPSAPQPNIVTSLWDTIAVPQIQSFERKVNKPILIAEIGFRDATDALHLPSLWTTTAPPDPSLQAAAYNAVMETVTGDKNIVGVYFWGWSVPFFQPNGTDAAVVLNSWYYHINTANK